MNRGARNNPHRFVVGRRWLLAALAGLAIPGEPAGAQAEARQPVPVDVYSPPLTGGPWLNTPGGKAIDLDSRRGKITIVHFWTFG